jgi:hypothetical protein
MPPTATINPTWAIKWLIVSVMLVFWGFYCLYDYYVGYPEANRRRDKIVEMQNLGSEHFKNEWPKVAAAEGWDVDDPTPGPGFSEQDIQTQITQMLIVWPLGAMAAGWLFYNYGRKISAGEETLVGPRGEQVPYGDITSIDKTRWRSKGIAFIHYGPPDRSRRIKFDDWLYKDIDKVLHEVENRTGITDTTTQTA